jgi:hypothetical protein
MIPPGFAGKLNLTVPLATVLGLAGRPGEIGGIGPIDPALARDLARAAACNPRTTWCVTVTDQDGHAIGHGCARPEPKTHRNEPGNQGTPGKPDIPRSHDPPHRARSGSGTTGSGRTGNRVSPPTAGPSGQDPTPEPGGPQFTFIAASQLGPPGGYGTWRLATGAPGQPDLIVAIEPIPAGECDHRHEAPGHDPGVMLRHLAQVRHATCTGPACRRPSTRADFEHNTPYQAGGRTCLCNGNPTCRHDHRVKQDPRWKVEQLASGHVRWTTPSGRRYTTEPTRYPI